MKLSIVSKGRLGRAPPPSCPGQLNTGLRLYISKYHFPQTLLRHSARVTPMGPHLHAHSGLDHTHPLPILSYYYYFIIPPLFPVTHHFSDMAEFGDS